MDVNKNNAYNDLLIKYNTMVYKVNTNDQSTIAKSESNQPYSRLRLKSPNDSRSREPRSKSANSDLAVRQNFSDPESFMVKGTGAVYLEDNCENRNPNFLRDPKLTALENENRFLKEEMKKQVAKAKFYKIKFK